MLDLFCAALFSLVYAVGFWVCWMSKRKVR